MYMAISPFSDLVAMNGSSGLAVATSTDGVAWSWLSWVVEASQLPERYKYEALAVGAGEQTVGVLADGRMMLVARLCSCANIDPPQVNNPFKCTDASTACEYGVSYSDNHGRDWSPLSTLAGAGSVAPTLRRFGKQMLLSGGRRGAFVWTLTPTGLVASAYNIRVLHNAHAPASMDKFTQNQTVAGSPNPGPLGNGESTSYMSLLKLSDSEGVIVYDMLAHDWAGPNPGGAVGPWGRKEDHVFAMRFSVS